MHVLRDASCARTVRCLPDLDVSGALNARGVVETELEYRFRERLARKQVMVDS